VNNSNLSLRGALHLHTTLSHDGALSLEDLVNFLKAKRYDYMAITEHSYDVDRDSMNKLVEKSAELSTPDFTIIPGIEYRCHGWVDILGYGVTAVLSDEEPAAVIDHIHAHGGVAVLAHPNIRDYRLEQCWISKLDGCEMWNVSNEGKYLPQPGAIDKFRELAVGNNNLLAFTGLDLHRPDSYCNLSTDTYVKDVTSREILHALKSGAFCSRSPLFSVNSRGDLSAAKGVRLRTLRTVLNGMRNMRDLIRR
jgi:hypothetical protein